MTNQVDQEVEGLAYEVLPKHLATVRNIRDFHKLLPTLARSAIRDRDPLRLLMLAEESIRWRQWQASAQVFAHALFILFEHGWDEAALAQHANHALELSHRRNPRLGSVTDVALYCFRRTSAALTKEEVRGRLQVDWIAIALAQIASSSKDGGIALDAGVRALLPTNASIGEGMRSQIGMARASFLKAQSYND